MLGDTVRVKLKPAELFDLLRVALLAFSQDKVPRMAAALSYQSLFAIAPLLFFVLAVASGVLTKVNVQDELFSFVAQNINESAAEFVRGLIPAADKLKQSSMIASVLGFVTLFMGSTSLFVQLQDSLNTLWGAQPGPAQGPLALLKTRLKSFGLVLLIGVVVIGFLVGNIYLSAMADSLGQSLGVGAFFTRIATLLVGIGVLMLVFAAIYKVLPNVRLNWHEVWSGAAITATLFGLAQLAISWYLGRFAPGNAFGTAAALVVLLMWMNFSAQIFFFGAEVTWVYSQKYGSGAGGAMSVTKKEELIRKGAHLDPTPSPQEQAGLQEALKQGKPVPRVAAVYLAEMQAAAQAKAVADAPFPARIPDNRTAPCPKNQLPSLLGALWNAVSAVLALPALLVLHISRALTGKSKKTEQAG